MTQPRSAQKFWSLRIKPWKLRGPVEPEGWVAALAGAMVVHTLSFCCSAWTIRGRSAGIKCGGLQQWWATMGFNDRGSRAGHNWSLWLPKHRRYTRGSESSPPHWGWDGG